MIELDLAEVRRQALQYAKNFYGSDFTLIGERTYFGDGINRPAWYVRVHVKSAQFSLTAYIHVDSDGEIREW